MENVKPEKLLTACAALGFVLLVLLVGVNVMARRAARAFDETVEAERGSYTIPGIFGDFVYNGDELTEYYGNGGDILFDESVYGLTADDITICTGAFNQYRLNEYGIEPETVYLGNAVTRIEDRAFYATTAEEIRLPAGLTYIGAKAFADSPNLKRVYFDWSTTGDLMIHSDAFEGSVNVELVNFPDGIVFDENMVIVGGGEVR